MKFKMGIQAVDIRGLHNLSHNPALYRIAGGGFIFPLTAVGGGLLFKNWSMWYESIQSPVGVEGDSCEESREATYAGADYQEAS